MILKVLIFAFLKANISGNFIRFRSVIYHQCHDIGYIVFFTFKKANIIKIFLSGASCSKASVKKISQQLVYQLGFDKKLFLQKSGSIVALFSEIFQKRTCRNMYTKMVI